MTVMLNEHPRKQLQFIIVQFGNSICTEPKRCEALLRDLCPEHKREVNLLVAALKEKVVDDLLKSPTNVPSELLLSRLSQRLHDNLGITEDFALWAVESWVISLSIIQYPMPKQAVQPNKKISLTQPKISIASSTSQIGTMGLSNVPLVQLVGTTLYVNVNSLAEAKLALKELKLKKKEFSLMKREINERQKAIRVSYTEEIKNYGSMVSGRGVIGKIFRTVQTISRDSKRIELASTLKPLEQEKHNVEYMINAIESKILQVESSMLKYNS